MPSLGPLNWTLIIFFNVQCLCIHMKCKHCVWKYDKSLLNLSCCVSIIASSQSTIELYTIAYWMCSGIRMAKPRKPSKSFGFIIYIYCTWLCCVPVYYSPMPHVYMYTQPTANGHRISQAYFIYPIFNFSFYFYIRVVFFLHLILGLCFGPSWIFILSMILYVQCLAMLYCFILHSSAFVGFDSILIKQFNLHKLSV